MCAFAFLIQLESFFIHGAYSCPECGPHKRVVPSIHAVICWHPHRAMFLLTKLVWQHSDAHGMIE